MTARAPRWELVHGPAGYWVRFRSSNGQIIVSSEQYKRKRDALRAIQIVTGGDIGPNLDGLLFVYDTEAEMSIREVEQ